MKCCWILLHACVFCVCTCVLKRNAWLQCMCKEGLLFDKWACTLCMFRAWRSNTTCSIIKSTCITRTFRNVCACKAHSCTLVSILTITHRHVQEGIYKSRTRSMHTQAPHVPPDHVCTGMRAYVDANHLGITSNHAWHTAGVVPKWCLHAYAHGWLFKTAKVQRQVERVVPFLSCLRRTCTGSLQEDLRSHNKRCTFK